MQKKILVIAFSTMMLFVAFSTNCFAEGAATSSATTTARMEQIKERLEEIKAMDKHTLNRQQRKELRHEVKAMDDEVKANNHSGLYIALGIVLLVVFLVVLIF